MATLDRVRNGRQRFGVRFIMPYYGKGSGTTGRDISRPIGTITTLDRWALLGSARMRMLSANKALAAMSFPAASTINQIEKKQRKRHTVEGLKAIREKSPLWLQNATDLALITAQRRTDILSMRFDGVQEGYLYVVQQKTAKASDAAWIRFKVTEELQAVISRFRDDIVSPYLILRRPERKKQKQAQTKHHWTQVEERYLSRAFKEAREAVRALSLHLYQKAGKDGQKITGHSSETMPQNYQE
ncbi:tyrosine-type recombinase/integrase, partial [Pseudomonas protegens]|uniref:tyrosine-type recombinase/integrase n=1 Tax=Pseudomonas protegens TaxID=380021 RepID=UPI0035A6E255